TGGCRPAGRFRRWGPSGRAGSCGVVDRASSCDATRIQAMGDGQAGRAAAAASACHAFAMTQPVPITASYAARIAFMVELAEHLHVYGTTSQRLEGAIVSIARRLGLECEPWSNPTGMILTFSDPQKPPGESDTTRVV